VDSTSTARDPGRNAEATPRHAYRSARCRVADGVQSKSTVRDSPKQTDRFCDYAETAAVCAVLGFDWKQREFRRDETMDLGSCLAKIGITILVSYGTERVAAQSDGQVGWDCFDTIDGIVVRVFNFTIATFARGSRPG